MKDKILETLFNITLFLIKNSSNKSIKIISNLIYYLDFKRKNIVLKNLEIAFPNLSKKERIKLSKEVYFNFIYYFIDMIKNINISKNELKAKVEIIGEDNLKKAVSSQKPIVFMTAHFGNWELVPKVVGAFYKPMLVLAREFENKKIEELFKKSRNSFNITTTSKDGSAKEIIKAFKEGKALGILIDQHSSSPNAVEVDFFNKKVKFNRGVTTLAKKFNAIVVPMFSYQKDGKYFIEFLEAKEFGKDDTIDCFTQWQASTIEEMIKKYPSEYYWFHKRFKNIKGIYD